MDEMAKRNIDDHSERVKLSDLNVGRYLGRSFAQGGGNHREGNGQGFSHWWCSV